MLSKITPEGVIAYYYYDAQGNLGALTDDAGNITDSYEYDPWGAIDAVSEASKLAYNAVVSAGQRVSNSRLYSSGQRTVKKVKRGVANYTSKLNKQMDRLVQTAKAVGAKAKEEAVSFTKFATNATLGASYEYANAMSFQSGSAVSDMRRTMDTQNQAFQIGRVIGAVGAGLTGVVEMAKGAGEVTLGGGFTFATDGFGAVAGGPLVADGIGSGSLGTGHILSSGISLYRSMDRMFASDEAEGTGEAVEQAAKTQLRRPYIRKSVREAVENNAPKTADGKFIDPNTGLPIEGKYDLGHKYGREFWREKAKAESEGLTQKQFNDRMNDPDLYQIEDPVSNRSHNYEMPR